MSFQNPKAVISSSVFRISIQCLLGFIAAVTIIGAILGFVARDSAVTATMDELAEIKQSIAKIYADGGMDALIAYAGETSAAPTEDESFLSVRRVPDGALLAGADVPAGPVGERFFHVPEGWDEDEEAYLSTILIGEGAEVTIGVSSENVHDIEELMATGFIALLTVGLPLTLFTGFVLSALVLKRLEPLTSGAARIGAGHLDHRIAATSRRDEFDGLSLAFNEMATSLQASYRNIRDVSAGVAHNLRTPLTRLRQHLFEAMGEADANKRLASKLEAADQEADELVRTFEALLRIGEIEAGQRRAAFRTISLSALAEEAVESFGPVAEDAGGWIKQRIDPGCDLTGDEDLIRQLLANLVENAIEHGGGNVEVRLFAHPNGAKLTIADSGAGIPADQRERIFERFYRTDVGAKRAGNGLGLSIVKSIVDLHRGHIHVDENDDGGATVHVQFVRSV